MNEYEIELVSALQESFKMATRVFNTLRGFYFREGDTIQIVVTYKFHRGGRGRMKLVEEKKSPVNTLNGRIVHNT